MKNTTKKISQLLLAITFSFSLSHLAHASDAQEKENMRKEASNNPVERIEVIGKKPLSHYMNLVEQAEEDFYSAYNKKVDDSDFKIVCREEAPTGTRIGKRVCYPKIVLKRVSRKARDARFAGHNYPREKLIAAELAGARKETSEYIAKVVLENPAIMEKFTNLKAKREALRAASQDG